MATPPAAALEGPGRPGARHQPTAMLTTQLPFCLTLFVQADGRDAGPPCTAAPEGPVHPGAGHHLL